MFTDILHSPIVENIFRYLDKTDIFTFLVLCKKCNCFSYYVYDNFRFIYERINDIDNRSIERIKHLTLTSYIVPELDYFTSLKTIIISNSLFDSKLDFIPKTVESIDINSTTFDKQIPNKYPRLKQLKINSMMFNSNIDDTLIKQLNKLTIISATYDKMPNRIDNKYCISSIVSRANSLHNKVEKMTSI